MRLNCDCAPCLADQDKAGSSLAGSDNCDQSLQVRLSALVLATDSKSGLNHFRLVDCLVFRELGD